MSILGLSMQSFHCLNHLAKQVLNGVRILPQEVSMIRDQIENIAMVTKLQSHHLVSFHHSTVRTRQFDFPVLDVRISSEHVIVAVQLVQ